MIITMDMIDKINAAKKEYGWDAVGVRIQDIPFNLGKIEHASHMWVNGEETDEELLGICAITAGDISAIVNYAPLYYGDHIAVLIGNKIGYGEDPGEIILSNAEVVYILA